MLKIVNLTGIANDTKVYNDGVEVKSIVSITIPPITRGDFVEAIIVCYAELDINAHDK
jgi:hypothetical protein